MKIRLDAAISTDLLQPYARAKVAKDFPSANLGKRVSRAQDLAERAVAILRGAQIRRVSTLLGDTVYNAALPDDVKSLAMLLRSDIRETGEVEFTVRTTETATAN